MKNKVIFEKSDLYLSDIAIFNEESCEADRVGVRLEDCKKVRYFKSSGQSVN